MQESRTKRANIRSVTKKIESQEVFQFKRGRKNFVKERFQVKIS